MIETFIFVIGVVLGVCVVLSIQWVYNWITSLSNRVQQLRYEAQRYTADTELWYEFHDWKRMNQKQKE
jgi:hypothetical protein